MEHRLPREFEDYEEMGRNLYREKSITIASVSGLPEPVRRA
jgi:hypothetical protein